MSGAGEGGGVSKRTKYTEVTHGVEFSEGTYFAWLETLHGEGLTVASSPKNEYWAVRGAIEWHYRQIKELKKRKIELTPNKDD